MVNPLLERRVTDCHFEGADRHFQKEISQPLSSGLFRQCSDFLGNEFRKVAASCSDPSRSLSPKLVRDRYKRGLPLQLQHTLFAYSIPSETHLRRENEATKRSSVR